MFAFLYFSGPDLPDECTWGSMVTSPTGDGVILLGCYENRDAIYKMAPDSNGAFVWTKMKQKLKYPRTYQPIVAPIDDEQVTCQWFIFLFMSEYANKIFENPIWIMKNIVFVFTLSMSTLFRLLGSNSVIAMIKRFQQ